MLLWGRGGIALEDWQAVRVTVTSSRSTRRLARRRRRTSLSSCTKSTRRCQEGRFTSTPPPRPGRVASPEARRSPAPARAAPGATRVPDTVRESAPVTPRQGAEYSGEDPRPGAPCLTRGPGFAANSFRFQTLTWYGAPAFGVSPEGRGCAEASAGSAGGQPLDIPLEELHPWTSPCLSRPASVRPWGEARLEGRRRDWPSVREHCVRVGSGPGAAGLLHRHLHERNQRP